MLDDMVQQGLINRCGMVYQPASAGWEFIQSSRIYSNMEPTPAEVKLVDADSGQTAVTVAGVEGNRVRVAGQSYDILPGGSGGSFKVRGVDAAADSPRYHTTRLPYAQDLGAAVAGQLGISSDVLAVVPVGDSVVVMTWWRQLLNEALAETLSASGVTAKDNAFSLVLRNKLPADALPLLKGAVQEVVQTNPLGRMRVEKRVDVGPHFRKLSPALQEMARRDWLDTDYLQRWLGQLQNVQSVAPDSSLGQSLLELP